MIIVARGADLYLHHCSHAALRKQKPNVQDAELNRIIVHNNVVFFMMMRVGDNQAIRANRRVQQDV